MWAAEEGHAKIVELLLNAGANVDSQDRVRCTFIIAHMHYCYTIS